MTSNKKKLLIFPIKRKTFLKNMDCETAVRYTSSAEVYLAPETKITRRSQFVIHCRQEMTESQAGKTSLRQEGYMWGVRAAAMTNAFSSCYRRAAAPSRNVAIPLLGLQPMLWIQPVRTVVTWRALTHTTASTVRQYMHTMHTKSIKTLRLLKADSKSKNSG